MVAYTICQTEEFQDWLDALADRRAQVRIAARLRHAEQGNLGDWKTVGGNVSEMRVSIRPGYRLYFTRRGKAEIVMLIGGSKASQLRDIKRARHLAMRLRHES